MLHSVAVMRFAVEASHDGRLNHDQEQLFYSFRADWLAGHVGLELRNVVANYPFESLTDLQESSRILATESIRV